VLQYAAFDSIVDSNDFQVDGGSKKLVGGSKNILNFISLILLKKDEYDL
jgi:hypothetical protein